MGLIIAITGAFFLLLASSKILFQGYRNLITTEPKMIEASDQQALTTGSLDNSTLKLPSADAGVFTTPHSVTDSTTRHLDPTLTKPE